MNKPPLFAFHAVLALVLFAAAPCARAAAETFVFSADRVTSSMVEGKERTTLSGRAKVRSGTLSIEADRIELSGRNFSLLECTGSVKAVDDEEGLRIETAHLLYDRTRKFSHMDGATVIEDLRNRVVLKARWIDNDGKSRVMAASVSVRILKEGLSCRAEYAIYRRDEKLLELTGAPVAYKDGDEYRATRIVIDTGTEDVRLEGAVQGSLTTGQAGDGAGKTDGESKADGAPPPGAEAPGSAPPGQDATPPAGGGSQ